MTTSSNDSSIPRRDRHVRSRLAGAAVAALVLTGSAAYAVTLPGSSEPRVGNALVQDLEARNAGQQVLGDRREPGAPSVQRLRHDNLVFTVTVAPARPGPNLVRVDAARADGRDHDHTRHRVYLGTPEDDDAGQMVLARPRPGTDGLWAVVDLPPGTGTLLVTHGPRHRVPFAIDTGSERPDAGDGAGDGAGDWTGDDGPECLGAATAAVLAGGEAPTSCPSTTLTDADRTALESTVDALTSRGVEELAVLVDDSARSQAAYDVVRGAADAAGSRVVDADAAPGPRNALLVLSGWTDAAQGLAAVSSTPLREQPIRSDGTWLAPWLLTPGVVDSVSGAVVPLDFDIRDDGAREFAQALATYLPGQAPTSSGYAAWRAARGDSPSALTLFAASRAAYLPSQPGHVGHETEVAWFPGGTVTPVGTLPAS